MSSLTIGLSKRSLILILIGFVGSTGLLSFRLIYKGLNSCVNSVIAIDPIIIPTKGLERSDGIRISTHQEELKGKKRR